MAAGMKMELDDDLLQFQELSKDQAQRVSDTGYYSMFRISGIISCSGQFLSSGPRFGRFRESGRLSPKYEPGVPGFGHMN